MSAARSYFSTPSLLNVGSTSSVTAAAISSIPTHSQSCCCAHCIRAASLPHTTTRQYAAGGGAFPLKGRAEGPKPTQIPLRPGLYQPPAAEELVHSIAPIVVDSNAVACDGGGGATGHPVVYMKLDVDAAVPCDYCGLRYIRRDAAEKLGIATRELD
eukprot:CAMPEP_0177649394 /NCGR_PEP_ID=MMETSP0447-20121125/11360_1 /TAXON_ID=0 /ORGANISM="Stygamoeba regulata, Strain BSH-02190019" /LENGTH=156 /DNA_ID=CAMNT_0019152143 /DNA_START=106 /DNA_END=576 /DNA_ORIENTATION=+